MSWCGNICEIYFLQEVNFVNSCLLVIYALEIAHSFCFAINLFCDLVVRSDLRIINTYWSAENSVLIHEVAQRDVQIGVMYAVNTRTVF
jgi:hypothetical protein